MRGVAPPLQHNVVMAMRSINTGITLPLVKGIFWRKNEAKMFVFKTSKSELHKHICTYHYTQEQVNRMKTISTESQSLCTTNITVYSLLVHTHQLSVCFAL
jgi:hypothetical protein